MMRDLWSVLPDDRPITSLCIVEDANRKPAGYHAVHRTYDQDTDADLWKEGFFGKKITRYLCHSKTEGQVGYLVDAMTVINDKDLPPEGFTALTHTSDSQQKATKKRIVCYRSAASDKAAQAITDIIVLSKSKKAPAGFTLAGDLNGHLICFKATAVPKGTASPMPVPNSAGSGSPVSPARSAANSVPNPASSNGGGGGVTNNLPYPMVPPPTPLYPTDQLQSVTNPSALGRNYTLPRNLEYGRNTWHPSHGGSQYGSRAASNRQSVNNHYHQPQPNYFNNGGGIAASTRHGQRQGSTAATTSTNLDGVGFEINQRYKDLKNLSNFVIPNVDKKTTEQLDAEYDYDFALEYQALNRASLQQHQ